MTSLVYRVWLWYLWAKMCEFTQIYVSHNTDKEIKECCDVFFSDIFWDKYFKIGTNTNFSIQNYQVQIKDRFAIISRFYILYLSIFKMAGDYDSLMYAKCNTHGICISPDGNWGEKSLILFNMVMKQIVDFTVNMCRPISDVLEQIS